MNRPHSTSLETRPSLLQRLKSGDDPQSWQDFYRIYGGLIRFFAEKAGLTADEAEEVVQETAIGVARHLPEFIYNPKVCRFKTWLLNLTRWRIQDQIRRRRKLGSRSDAAESGARMGQLKSGTSLGGVPIIESIADPSVPEFGAEWDKAWEKNLLDQALEALRVRIEERQLQVFDLCVTKGWPPGDVAETLGISVARVYLAKHRVSVLLKKEVRRLECLAEKRDR
jgi:RNA polymerase sigma factor (sigma-70 family)